MNITTLKILSKIANDKRNIKFSFISPKTKEILCTAATLEELYNCILELDAEIIKNHVSLSDESKEETRDLAFWVQYILADADLSMKIYSVAKRYSDDAEKLKLELINILFTRLLNISEIAEIPE